ncbi:uncharacterized protein LOC107413982 isoform X2 [Ziziphus jujuba]|uniref:Uncharacterized protein LOC107413982 isoform X2 n=1 Tax=Ziziphus jujuba TaxID=326968 RepID=A0ABM4AG32_ZIZJJ|nr:uncharacterized protein LOC107413982 isoform X2 [Ziziphus jujuba]
MSSILVGGYSFLRTGLTHQYLYRNPRPRLRILRLILRASMADDDKQRPETENGVVRFPLSPSYSIVIQRGDITKWFVHGSTDAIVNAAEERMLGGGGVDGAIHRAAGPDLLQACYNVPEVRPGVRCPTGEARITPGFQLPVSYVIHTVGPIYETNSDPEAFLKSAYSLKVAKENNVQYVAFPAISCGVYGYPYEEAATISISTVKEFANDFKEVHFVLYNEDIYNVWLKKANELLQSSI